jgi:hypothetical protein
MDAPFSALAMLHETQVACQTAATIVNMLILLGKLDRDRRRAVAVQTRGGNLPPK